jgi:hypothetical protein
MHVKNLSTLTDKAALLLAADYYNDRDNAELIKAMKDLNVGIKKRGHTFTIFDKEDEEVI